MTDRVSSEHSSVSTIRATVGRRGATTKPRVRLASDDAHWLPDEDVVRVVLDGTTAHAVPRRLPDGRVVIDGVYDTPSLARNPGNAADRLAAWLEANDREIGRTVLLDVVVEEFLYGLRAPGEEVVYTVREPPSASLADIAAQVEGTESTGED